MNNEVYPTKSNYVFVWSVAIVSGIGLSAFLAVASAMGG